MSAPARPAARRRSAFATMLHTELLLLLRSPGTVLWAAVVPVLALVALGLVPVLRDPQSWLHGASYLQLYLPVLVAFSLCMSTVNALPPALAAHRASGVLRRLSTTPVPPRRLLAAQATLHVGTSLVVAVVLLVVATSCFGVAAPGEVVGLVGSLLLTAAATTGVGLLVAALARSPQAANAASLAAFFPLMFLAGLWLPRAQMPPVLRTVSDLSPLGAGVRALTASLDGSWPPLGAWAVLAAWAALTGAVAARSFRWE